MVVETHSTAFYDFCIFMDHSDHSNSFYIFKNPLVKVLALQRNHNRREPTAQMNIPDGWSSTIAGHKSATLLLRITEMSGVNMAMSALPTIWSCLLYAG